MLTRVNPGDTDVAERSVHETEEDRETKSNGTVKTVLTQAGNNDMKEVN